MSPAASTTAPLAEPSFGKVCTWPAPQWSKRPGDSAYPYWIMVGYSPSLTARSLPPARRRRMVFARLRRPPRLGCLGALDHHAHTRAGLPRVLEPAREQRNVEADEHVRRLDRLER